MTHSYRNIENINKCSNHHASENQPKSFGQPNHVYTMVKGEYISQNLQLKCGRIRCVKASAFSSEEKVYSTQIFQQHLQTSTYRSYSHIFPTSIHCTILQPLDCFVEMGGRHKAKN